MISEHSKNSFVKIYENKEKEKKQDMMEIFRKQKAQREREVKKTIKDAKKRIRRNYKWKFYKRL